jgi:hypothetical protein
LIAKAKFDTRNKFLSTAFGNQHFAGGRADIAGHLVVSGLIDCAAVVLLFADRKTPPSRERSVS